MVVHTQSSRFETFWTALAVVTLGTFSLAGCDVQSTGGRTGGVGGTGGAGGDGCPGGAAVVLSDYVSTQVALTSRDGRVRSASFLSTASSETDGLAFALSGDVALPSEAPASGRIVLLDRFGTNVVTWADPASGEVLEQLPVGTGFESNPRDYVEVGEERAFVSRWSQNGAPGDEAFDGGGDLLIIDTQGPHITGSIAMPEVDGLPPRPSALTRVADEVIVTLDRVARDFSTTGEAMLIGVSIDDEGITWEKRLEGHKSCGKATPSPDKSLLAVVCTGALDSQGNVEDLAQSAILLFDAVERPLRRVASFSAEDIGGEPLQDKIAFTDDAHVLVQTQTPLGGDSHNRLLWVDLDTGRHEEVLKASGAADGSGKGLVYGGLACFLACSRMCLMADADRKVLQRLSIEGDGRVELLEPVRVEEEVGLPPIGVSAY